MPFVSRRQQRLCYAKRNAGTNGTWNCDEFSAVTNFKKLPEKVEAKKEALAVLLKAARQLDLANYAEQLAEPLGMPELRKVADLVRVGHSLESALATCLPHRNYTKQAAAVMLAGFGLKLASQLEPLVAPGTNRTTGLAVNTAQAPTSRPGGAGGRVAGGLVGGRVDGRVGSIQSPPSSSANSGNFSSKTQKRAFGEAAGDPLLNMADGGQPPAYRGNPGAQDLLFRNDTPPPPVTNHTYGGNPWLSDAMMRAGDPPGQMQLLGQPSEGLGNAIGPGGTGTGISPNAWSKMLQEAGTTPAEFGARTGINVPAAPPELNQQMAAARQQPNDPQQEQADAAFMRQLNQSQQATAAPRSAGPQWQLDPRVSSMAGSVFNNLMGRSSSGPGVMGRGPDLEAQMNRSLGAGSQAGMVAQPSTAAPSPQPAAPSRPTMQWQFNPQAALQGAQSGAQNLLGSVMGRSLAGPGVLGRGPDMNQLSDRQMGAGNPGRPLFSPDQSRGTGHGVYAPAGPGPQPRGDTGPEMDVTQAQRAATPSRLGTSGHGFYNANSQQPGDTGAEQQATLSQVHVRPPGPSGHVTGSYGPGEPHPSGHYTGSYTGNGKPRSSVGPPPDQMHGQFSVGPPPDRPQPASTPAVGPPPDQMHGQDSPTPKPPAPAGPLAQPAPEMSPRGQMFQRLIDKAQTGGNQREVKRLTQMRDTTPSAQQAQGREDWFGSGPQNGRGGIGTQSVAGHRAYEMGQAAAGMPAARQMVADSRAARESIDPRSLRASGPGLSSVGPSNTTAGRTQYMRNQGLSNTGQSLGDPVGRLSQGDAYANAAGIRNGSRPMPQSPSPSDRPAAPARDQRSYEQWHADIKNQAQQQIAARPPQAAPAAPQPAPRPVAATPAPTPPPAAAAPRVSSPPLAAPSPAPAPAPAYRPTQAEQLALQQSGGTSDRRPNSAYRAPAQPARPVDPNIGRIMAGEQVPFGGPVAGAVAPGKAPWPQAPSVTPPQPPQLAQPPARPPLNQGASLDGGMPSGLHIGGPQNFGFKGFGQANKSPGAGLAAGALKGLS